ncbi:hypothetical protein EGW08_021592 [Elysia chlorotica]|uniref:Uncharacterized protein n=1 Tax=Elysia chlorotica TaxID=188477 RepID=A0A433SN31_ELYCH|nr:hypothetical protein EGW08_021592 [Elysia chlorotica]
MTINILQCGPKWFRYHISLVFEMARGFSVIQLAVVLDRECNRQDSNLDYLRRKPMFYPRATARPIRRIKWIDHDREDHSRALENTIDEDKLDPKRNETKAGVVCEAGLWRRTEHTPTDIQIKKRKWGWIGHTLRKPPTDITRQSLERNPQGKRKNGRPKQIWRRRMEAEIRSAGRTWTELKRDAQNRVRWRGVALALCSSGDPEA